MGNMRRHFRIEVLGKELIPEGVAVKEDLCAGGQVIRVGEETAELCAAGHAFNSGKNEKNLPAFNLRYSWLRLVQI